MSEPNVKTVLSSSQSPPPPPDISTPRLAHSLFQRNLCPADTSLHIVPPLNQTTPSQIPGVPQDVGRSPAVPMEMATPPQDYLSQSSTPQSTSASETSTQHDLPSALPTPGRTLGKLALQSLAHPDNWAVMTEKMDKHTNSLNELGKQMGRSRFHLEAKLHSFAENTEQLLTKINTGVSENKNKVDKVDTELGNLFKGMKTMFEEEIKKQDVARAAEVSFMVKQLQLEVQQEIQGHHHVFLSAHADLSKKMDHCVSMVDQLAKSVNNLQALVLQKNTELNANIHSLEKKMEDSFASTNTVLSHQRPVTNLPASLLPTVQPSSVKTDHLKLSFPTYGRPQDDPDPVLYLSKCQDFLAVQPLSDVDILATFRTVLHGTARDWWEIARAQVGTWADFQRDFLSAFLSADYEEELADRVRSRRQGEHEPIRDFAFSYRALCKRWNPNMADCDIVKMILKNTKPQLTSQLRGRVNTVDELVYLGHQLERDLEQQMQYEQQKAYSRNMHQQKVTPNKPVEKPMVTCWRCKGQHPPGSCPQFRSAAEASQMSSAAPSKAQ